MGEVQINGKSYENADSASLQAMAAMGYYVFRYFPQDKLIINADSTVEAYQCKQIYTDMPFTFIDEFVDEEYRQQYIKLYQDIDAGVKKASVLFRMKKREGMCKVTLVPTAYDAEGKLEQVLGLVEDVTDVVETEKEHTKIISGLSSIYFAIYQLDFQQATFQELFTKNNIHATLGAKGNARDALTNMVEKLILPDSQDVMRAFNEVSTMPDRIGDKKIISQDYRGLTTGWSRASIIPNEWDENGKPTKALYCTRMIGHEKEKVEAQSNLINALVANYQDVYVLNLDTGISSAYRMSSVMALRYGEWFAVGDYEKNISTYIDAAVVEADRKLFHQVRTIAGIKKLFEERERYSFTYRECRKNGTVYFQYQLIRPTKNRNEVIAALKDVDSDVREEIKQAKAKNEQLGVIQALSNKFESVFFVNPADGKAIPYHLSDEKKSDYGERFATGVTWDEIVNGYAENGVHSDYVEEFVTKASVENILNELREKSAFIYEYKSNYGEAEHFYQIKAVPVQGGDSHSIIIGIADVNEEREQQMTVQKALQDAYNAAHLANNAKTDFLANMSHDIRTPMNAIIGMTAIAATHIDDKERVQDCLKKITASSKHLLSLVNEVLDMSKIESGKIDLAEEDFNLSELIDNLLTMVRPQIEAYDHELLVNIKNVEHEQVVGDSLRIQQLFVNLMSNAIKYTPKGGKIKLSITEKHTNRHKVGFYEVVFEDNGIGMSKEFMEKLFEPFSRAQDDRIRKVQGTGLGMAISRNIVNMMGGNIEVESEVNKGTKFIVTFFLKLGDLGMKTEGELSGKKAVNRGAARPETMPLQNFEDMDLSGYRVLLVEDNELNVEITTEILEMTGITVDVANDGSEAVDMIRERGDIKYDLILMDIQMPKMNGYDATRAIRNLGCDYCKSVPIIAMTANAFAEDVQAAFSAGMNEHIAKPLDLKALAGVLDKWVLGKG